MKISRKTLSKGDVYYETGIAYYFNEGIPIKPIEYIHKDWCTLSTGEYAVELMNSEFINSMSGNCSVHWFTNMVLFNIEGSDVHYATRPMNNIVLPQINKQGYFMAIKGSEMFKLEHSSIKNGYRVKKMTGPRLANAYNAVLTLQSKMAHQEFDSVELTVFP